jgi:Tol biopolymer transport system component
MCDLYVQNLDAEVRPAGPLRRITRQNAYLAGVAWAPDGKALVYSASRNVGVNARIWRVGISESSPPERYELAGASASNPAVAPAGNRMVYTSSSIDLDIWQWQRGGDAEQFIASTLHDDNPQHSPDGERIAFASAREGNRQSVWVCNKDGSGAIQLSKGIGRISGSPRWSPDGKTIVFDVQLESGRMGLFSVSASGGPPRQVSEAAHDEAGPSYSHDGKWIYFRSNPTGRFEIYRMPVGGGTKERITESGGYVGLESHDGQKLYFTVGASTAPTSLMEKPIAGGPVRKVADNVYPRAFAPVASGIYYIARRQPRGWALYFYSFKTRSTKTLLEIESGVFHGLSVSPDEKTFLYTANKSPRVDLMLVENFR